MLCTALNSNGSTAAHITHTYTYTYDTAGNIQSETKTVGSTTTTKSYTYSAGDWKDLLIEVGGTAISYDSNGNPSNWYNGSKTYSKMKWANGRQLTSVTIGSKTADYAYDANGIRTQKTVGDVTHTYYTLNGKLMRETFPDGDVTIIMDFIYDESGNPFAVCYSKNGGTSFTTYFYGTNAQGDVEKIFRVLQDAETGEYEEKVYGYYTYDAWGNVTAKTAAGNTPGSTTLVYRNPIRYRGYVYDNETGWYYLQSRYYDPVNHRFINADSYASTDSTDAIACNMFAYCENNPILNVDSNGHKAVAQPAGNPDNPFFARPEDWNSYKLLKELNKYRVSATGLPFDFSYWSGDNILNARFSVISYTKKYSNEESVVAGIASAVGDVCTLAGGVAAIPVVPIPKIAAGGIAALGVGAFFVEVAFDNGCDVPYSEYTFYNVTFCWEETERYGTVHNEYTYTWTYAIPTCVDPSRGIPIMYQLINGKPCQIY